MVSTTNLWGSIYSAQTNPVTPASIFYKTKTYPSTFRI